MIVILGVGLYSSAQQGDEDYFLAGRSSVSLFHTSDCLLVATDCRRWVFYRIGEAWLSVGMFRFVDVFTGLLGCLLSAAIFNP